MRFNQVKPLGLLITAIPFLAMLYMIATNELNFKNHTEYRVEITGYDPRDLLTGHYLTFRYKWPEAAANNCKGRSDCYACFNGAATSPAITLEPQGNIGACAASLKLERNTQPKHNLLRYNVPETQAPVLDIMLRERQGKFEIGILVYPNHDGQVKTLYIDGQTLPNFFK